MSKLRSENLLNVFHNRNDDDAFYMGSLMAELVVRAGGTATIVTPDDTVATWSANTLEYRHLQKRLHARLFDAYSKMSYRYYVTRDTGYFFNLFSQVVSLISAFQVFAGFTVGTVKSMVYLGTAIVVAWTFGVAALVIGVGLFLLFRRLNQRIRELSKASAEHMGEVSSTFVQTIQSFKYLSATDSAEPLRRHTHANVERTGDLAVRLNLLMAFTAAVREPIGVMAIVAIGSSWGRSSNMQPMPRVSISTSICLA